MNDKLVGYNRYTFNIAHLNRCAKKYDISDR